MKKLFSGMLILMVGIGMIYAQSITVTNPHAGSVWCKQKTYKIQWTKSGEMDEDVKIRLYDSTGTTKILDITNSTDNDGEYHWSVPSSVPSGDYVIRVKTLDGLVSDDSDVFKIQTCARVDVYQGKLPILSMSAAELAIYMKGPGPRIRKFGQLKDVMAKYGMKTPLTVVLRRNGNAFLNLGTYRPTLAKDGQVLFNTIPDELVLRLNKKQMMLLKTGKNFMMVLKTKGKGFAKIKVGFYGQKLKFKQKIR